jgi:hypothetical protein
MRQTLLALALAAIVVLAAPAPAQTGPDDSETIITNLFVNTLTENEIVIGEQARPFYRGQVRIYDVDGTEVTDLKSLNAPFEARATYRGVTSDGRPKLAELSIVIRYAVGDDGRLHAARWTSDMEEQVRRAVR